MACLPIRETVEISELLGVNSSYARAAVDDKQLEVGGKNKLNYAAIEIELRLLLEVYMFSRCRSDPAAAFLPNLTEKHDVVDAEFLVERFSSMLRAI